MSINLLFTNPEVPLIPMNVSTWNSFSTNTSTLDIVGTANQIDVVTLGGTTTISLDDKINTPGDLNVSGSLTINSNYGFPDTIGSAGQCLTVTSGSPILAWSTPSISNLPNNVTINSTLNVGATNAGGSFVFDANGNLTLPLNSNGNASTYIRAGDNSGTSTNTIDMFCNWNSSTGLYGSELYLSNSQAIMGINGVNNNLQNFISVDNTTTNNSGTILARVVNSNNISIGSVFAMNSDAATINIPNGNLSLNYNAVSGYSSFVATCSNTKTTPNPTYSMIFKADDQVGGFLYAPYIGAANFNVAGAYDLATTQGSLGSVLTSGGDGTTSWQNPASVNASYCCIYNIPSQNSGSNPNYPLILNTASSLKTNDYTINANSITLQPNSVYKIDYSFSFVQFVSTTCLCQIVAPTQSAVVTIAGGNCQINTSGQPMSATGIITTDSGANPVIEVVFSSNASIQTYAINNISITRI